MVSRANITRRLLACGVAIVAIASAAQASAQEAPADAESAATVQEVVVTANKREEKLHDVAMSVTALTGSKLDLQQNFSFADYAAQIPSLSLQSESPGQTRVTLRGQNAGGVGSTVAVYLDDSPFGSSNALANGAIVTGDFETFDLRRVEVLRGPQGTLYGASTEGGLLKFVTNAPNPDAFSAKVEAGAQSVEHGEAGVSLKGMVNLPLIDGKAALRLTGYGQNLPGYIDNPLLGLKDVNGGDKYGWRASFLYEPTEALSIRLTAIDQHLSAGDASNVDVVGAPFYDPNGAPPVLAPPNQLSPSHGDLEANQYAAGYAKDDIKNYSGTMTWDAGPVTVTSITSYGILKLSQKPDLTSVLAIPGFTYGDYVSLLVYGVPTGLDEPESTKLHKFTQEFRIASPSTDRLSWQIGAFYTRESSEIAQTIRAFDIASGAPAGGPEPGGANLSAVYKEWSGFGELTYRFNDQFDVAVGGRYSTNDQTAANTSLPGYLTGAADTLEIASSGEDFTWSIAPRWHVDANTMVYGRVATGYRPGGPNAIPASAPASVPRQYESDSTLNYELGVRSNLLDDKLSVDVTAFYVDWDSIQLRYVIDGLYGINGNGGKARNQGVEWTLGLNPIPGLSLNFSGSYVDAKLLTTGPVSAGVTGINAQPGDELPFVPKLSGALDGQYEWSAFADYEAFVGGTFSYMGPRNTDFVAGDLSVSHLELPSYSTLALRAGLENDAWLFEVYAKNVTDERGINTYSSSGAPGLNGTIGVIQPRTVGVLLSRKFN